MKMGNGVTFTEAGRSAGVNPSMARRDAWSVRLSVRSRLCEVTVT